MSSAGHYDSYQLQHLEMVWIKVVVKPKSGLFLFDSAKSVNSSWPVTFNAGRKGFYSTEVSPHGICNRIPLSFSNHFVGHYHWGLCSSLAARKSGYILFSDVTLKSQVYSASGIPSWSPTESKIRECISKIYPPSHDIINFNCVRQQEDSFFLSPEFCEDKKFMFRDADLPKLDNPKVDSWNNSMLETNKKVAISRQKWDPMVSVLNTSLPNSALSWLPASTWS